MTGGLSGRPQALVYPNSAAWTALGLDFRRRYEEEAKSKTSASQPEEMKMENFSTRSLAAKGEEGLQQSTTLCPPAKRIASTGTLKSIVMRSRALAKVFTMSSGGRSHVRIDLELSTGAGRHYGERNGSRHLGKLFGKQSGGKECEVGLRYVRKRPRKQGRLSSNSNKRDQAGTATRPPP